MGDTVGAAGVPHLLGYAMAAASALFVGQRILAMRTSIVATTEPESRGVFEDARRGLHVGRGRGGHLRRLHPDVRDRRLHAFGRAAHLCDERLSGRPPGLRLVAISAGGAVMLWLIFALLLERPHAPGIWSDLF